MSDHVAAVEPRVRARPFGDYVRLAFHAVVSMLDVGLLVLGSALVALAAVVLLDGFGVVAVRFSESIGAMLGSGIVIAVFGAFGLGVAAEGPVGRGIRVRVGPGERAAAQGAAGLLVAAGLMALASRLARYTAELPGPFETALNAMRAAGLAGLVAAPVGVVGVYFARRRWRERRWLEESEVPLLYVLWAAGTMAFF